MAQRTIGDIADEVLVMQAKIKKKEDEVKVLEEKAAKLKEELRLAADAEGLTAGGGKKSKFTIDAQIVPQANNWDQFWAYIDSTKYFHLVQRRPAVKACQELWEQNIAIPGIDKFTIMKVNVKGV